MLPVSAAELLSIQAEATSAVCDQPCQIWRKSSLVADGYGTQSNGYTQIATTVVGTAQPSAGELANYDYLIADKAAFTLHFPIATSVQEQDHVVIGTQTLEVHVLLTPESYP